ncbi:MAG: GNAT family N-acetyltransferase [Leptolyngbyaceae cyanobacterium SM1_1_3]|nr:GNAT family N-acetyltransferase [Leptolyngbyaceae cyanobacterium SM1_1_3]NJN04089.1 GNAT family N-acetyltransferase [Leptolyngbyaceae cyanobacterium RM1_1_2]NJO11255.1 GNAT family N-acetyltransferase [Leptolyngbyaceae cyanobacterium SL_1_1]
MGSLPEPIKLRLSTEPDLDFILSAEQHPENARFVVGWTRSRHQACLEDPDELHYILQDTGQQAVGYLILTGLTSPHHALELCRLVVTEKGRGYGRSALRQAQQLAFETYNAHRLWLDLKVYNHRAKQLYEQEGFVEEGILRECIKTDQGFESLILMSILHSEYFQA